MHYGARAIANESAVNAGVGEYFELRELDRIPIRPWSGAWKSLLYREALRSP